jgi:hypothetical protein
MLDSSTKHKREGMPKETKDKSEQIAKAKGTNEPEKEKRMRTEKQCRKLYEYILLWAEKMGFAKLPTATHLGFEKPLYKKIVFKIPDQKHQTEILSSLSKNGVHHHYIRKDIPTVLGQDQLLPNRPGSGTTKL